MVWFTLIGLGIAFGSVIAWGKILGYGVESAGIETDTESREKLVSDASKWLSALTLVSFVVLVERKTLGSIGIEYLPLPQLAFGVVISFVVLLFVADMLIQKIVTPFVEKHDLGTIEFGIEDLIELPLYQRILLVLTAGVTEQILFFGYPIERLSSLFGSPILAAGLAVFFFGLAHYRFWGLGATLQIGTKGIFLAGLYLWYRNLLILIVAHALNDFVGTVIYPLVADVENDEGKTEEQVEEQTETENEDSEMGVVNSLTDRDISDFD